MTAKVIHPWVVFRAQRRCKDHLGQPVAEGPGRLQAACIAMLLGATSFFSPASLGGNHLLHCTPGDDHTHNVGHSGTWVLGQEYRALRTNCYENTPVRIFHFATLQTKLKNFRPDLQDLDVRPQGTKTYVELLHPQGCKRMC